MKTTIQIRGIRVFETRMLLSGTAICLPGIGIFVHAGLSSQAKERVIQHEFGHYLDFQQGYLGNRKKLLGSYLLGFYVLIGLPSLLNLTPGFRLLSPFKGDHRRFWTELRANRLAKDFFGKELAPNFERYFPVE